MNGAGDNQVSPAPFPLRPMPMPDLVVSDAGERYFLDRMLRTPFTSTDTLTIRLFVNDYTPLKGVTIDDVVEAAWSAYLPVDLDPATWTEPATFGGVAVSFYGVEQLVWPVADAPDSVYGYFVTAEVDGVRTLLIAQRPDGWPVVIAIQPALVLPQMRLHSESQP